MRKATKQELERAAKAIVAAWEKPGPAGHYPNRVIERWLAEDMHPAINGLRNALGIIPLPPHKDSVKAAP